MTRTMIGGYLALLMALSSPASANDSQAERASLTRLSEISIVVEDLSAVAVKAGLKAADLQKDAVDRVKAAGIVLKPDSDAYLYVQITVADTGGTFPLVYFVNVSLMQEVTLPRGVKTRTPLQCPTWSLNSLGLTTSDRLKPILTERINAFVDGSVTAYRSVNPKA